MDIKVPIHSSIIINDNVFIDPYNLPNNEYKAKHVFITHSHYDHFSLEDINKITYEHTIFYAPKDVYEMLKNKVKNTIILVEPNKNYETQEIKFSTFASYNISKSYHPKENGWVGYNIIIEDKNVVIVGDSDITNELKSQKADILFIPIGGKYTMNSQEAAEITNILKPQLVVPVHYNSIIGNKNDEIQFVNKLKKDIEVKICIK